MLRVPIAPRIRSALRPTATFFLFLAGGVVLLRMDPFGFSRLTKIYSQDLLAVAMAGCYPDAHDGPCVKKLKAADDREIVRAATAVVLLRDPDLEAFKEPWPPRYGFHARVLKAIRANAPKALVLDIVFEDVRDDPTIDVLAAELDRYREKDIPVYAATFGPHRPLRPEVGRRVIPVQVPKLIDPLDRVTRFYELDTGPPASLPTAVPTVFHDVCGGCDARAGCGTGSLRVFWSILAPNDWNQSWLNCRHRPPFPWWIFQDRGSDFRENCPSTPAVPVKVLLEPQEDEDVAIEDVLSDSVVFYGAFYHGAADSMNTPLHNDLPAVFLHSMALDNLITVGPDTLRHHEREVPLLGVSLPDFLLLVLIGLFFTLHRAGGKFARTWEAIMRRVHSRIGRVALVALGSQIGMLVILAGLASFLACWVGASEWILGVNFLFAITWTEVLDITEKLFEAADEIETHGE